MSYTLPAFPVEYLEIIFIDENEKEHEKQVIKQNLPFGVSEIFFASVKSAKYLAQGEDVKTVVEVCLNIQNSNYEYEPGQTFGILPKNNIEEVNQIIERLNLSQVAQKLFKVAIKKDCTKKNAKIPPHVPNNSTIVESLVNYLDIRSVPKKLFLRSLTKYTTDENEINNLNELCSTQGTAKYNDFISNNYMTLLELLKTFKSCSPPFSLLLEHLPKLQPRPYSVSSSPNETNPPNNELKFVYSLEILPNSYKGVCTGWLNKELELFLLNNTTRDTKIPIYLRKPNDFKLPDLSTNIILICAGTGLAPFVSFLKHRDFEIKNCKDTNFGKILLFFGCRFAERDFLYKTELNNFTKSNVLYKLYTSFSRENNTVKYVQDNIKIHENELIDFFGKNSVVFVCGGSKMCKDVSKTIMESLCRVKNYPEEEGTKELNELKKQKKYVEDIWT